MNNMWKEIQLDAELMAVFSRRGRSRLRTIQVATGAMLRLDAKRGVLHVTGSPDAFTNVQKHLDGLGGPRKTTTAATWAELMRTRMSEDPTYGAVACMQQKSGLRVHIERGAQEVRLFGGKDAVVIAERLLHEFEQMCTEETVVGPGGSLDTEILTELAHRFGVSLRLEGSRGIVVLGLYEPVDEAAQELRRYFGDPSSFQLGQPSAAAANASSSAMQKLQQRDDGTIKLDKLSAAITTCGSLPSHQSDEESNPELQSPVGKTQGHNSQMLSNPGQENSQAPEVDRCNNCSWPIGIGNFCCCCGAQVRQFDDFTTPMAFIPAAGSMQVPMCNPPQGMRVQHEPMVHDPNQMTAAVPMMQMMWVTASNAAGPMQMMPVMPYGNIMAESL